MHDRQGPAGSPFKTKGHKLKSSSWHTQANALVRRLHRDECAVCGVAPRSCNASCPLSVGMPVLMERGCRPAESAYLLGCLIYSCPRLVMPYIWPILRALVAKLRLASFGIMMPQAPAVLDPSKGPLQGEQGLPWAHGCEDCSGISAQRAVTDLSGQDARWTLQRRPAPRAPSRCPALPCG